MIIRKRLLFKGSVQGVGFRPFLWRQARDHGLAGLVRNRPDGVAVEVEGTPEALAAFAAAVCECPPPRARITGIAEEEIPPTGEPGFVIAASEAGLSGELHITPDTAVCDACLAEFSDPGNRRFHYPFINCTDCGPRLTIIEDLPYDRSRTAMACFPLCPRCRQEYEDPADRRFHAEPNACPDCGPRLMLLDARGAPLAGDPVAATLGLLGRGAVVAVKGLGGFHLCCDAANDAAVQTLRRRKCREEKPLAVMARDLGTAEALALLGPAEAELLTSPMRPICLLARREGTAISPSVAPGMDSLGIMLPYTPLQHLLLAGPFPALVMTSANRTDEPICIANREAIGRLAGIADAFLVHDRDILVRCDDSVALVTAGNPMLLRRSRGYAPAPIALSRTWPEVLALGGQLKNALCILKGNFAFLSPHIGDLETPEARDFLTESKELLERVAECRPGIVACDLHPGYHTSRLARQFAAGMQVVSVQHHHAHIVSCMAENGLTGPVIGLAMDGTGFGADGEAWGGEFFIADEGDFRRAGHLRPLPLPGGERAIREPWRLAAALLAAAWPDEWREWAGRLGCVPDPSGAGAAPGGDGALIEGLARSLDGRLPVPRTSGLGRLFDGVAALLGLRSTVSFEGQAAMELEALAAGRTDLRLPYGIERPLPTPGDPREAESPAPLVLDLVPTVPVLAEARLAGRSAAELALAFHNLLAESFTAVAVALRRDSGLQRVCLSGGCFQNRRLLAGCRDALTAAGFAVYHHRLVPPNDGGLSLGQAVCAGARLEKGALST